MSEDEILLVDDEPNVITSLKRALIDEPYIIFQQIVQLMAWKYLERIT